ncbi:MAG TPA: hypothetical protein ENO23_10960 [Alphaproteobacteria bacterium]|nr:hypothetical protein [Alphaproteobacteria bacterium]
MSRTIQDQDLQIWEAYASSGEDGFPARSKLVFHCLSDRTRKARFSVRDGAKSDVEKEVATLSDAQLAEILSGADELK